MYPKHLILHILSGLTLLLTACSTINPTPPPATSPTLPSGQDNVGGHLPVVLRVVEREEIKDGSLFVYDDIYFTDPDGDAVAVTYQWVSSTLPYPLILTDDPINTSAEEQKREALFTIPGRCWQKMELVFESRIKDQAGNLSEPVRSTMSCSAPQAMNITSFLITGLSMALPIALILLAGFWLLFRKNPVERSAALQSTLLLFCLILLLKFVQLIFHEGGHSLYLLVNGIPITLYVHPFTFAGFSRPIVVSSPWWTHILGSATALPVALLISLPFWKRRSQALLPLVMIFAFTALNDGMNILPIEGDFSNLVQITGWPSLPFFILGISIIIVGMLSIFALLPLVGLAPQDKKVLFVFPAALFLISVLSLCVAHIFVPGSPIDTEYFAGREIIASANSILMVTITGVLLAVIYVTLYRKVYSRLPAWLRTEKADLAWKDLRLPGFLAVTSVILGLIIIT